MSTTCHGGAGGNFALRRRHGGMAHLGRQDRPCCRCAGRRCRPVVFVCTAPSRNGARKLRLENRKAIQACGVGPPAPCTPPSVNALRSLPGSGIRATSVVGNGCTVAPMSSRRCPLRDHDLIAITNGSLGALRRSEPAQPAARQRARSSMRKGRCRRRTGKQRRGRRSSAIRRDVELPREPFPVAVTAADQTEATGSTDCRGQRASGNAGHRAGRIGTASGSCRESAVVKPMRISRLA
jgi:hypothetical protein